MLKWTLRLLLFLFCITGPGKCIDPYNPHLGNYQKLLVVEGMVTDDPGPYEIRLTRTFQSVDSVPEPVNDALVFITDGESNRTDYYKSGSGYYHTPDQFEGIPGNTYVLHIQTADGKMYESEPCIMSPVTGIDSVYWDKDEVIDNINNKILAGLRIYVDSDELPEGNQYFRWAYEETWKFRLPSPQKFLYVHGEPPGFIPISNIMEFCWKSNKSTDIMTGSVVSSPKNKIVKQPVLFIGSDQSDRLTIQYSLLLKQLSLSDKEFYFWNNLRAVNETGGNIFDKQPWPVISNISNIEDADEKVLGYFSVSAVKTKRIFITFRNAVDLNLPIFDYKCTRYSVSPETYTSPGSPPPTWDEIYNMFMRDHTFTFVEPESGMDGSLKIVFAKNECSDCSLTGSTTRPDF